MTDMTTFASTTTLNRIRATSPCEDGWQKLLKHLGKSKADDEPLELLTVLDSNGLEDALWVLFNAMPDDRLARHFQAWCAEQVLHHFESYRPNDSRVRDQIAVLRNDDATSEARVAARVAARDAAGDARSAEVAARSAEVAARAAVWAAAGVAARAAQEKQLRRMIGQ